MNKVIADKSWVKSIIGRINDKQGYGAFPLLGMLAVFSMPPNLIPNVNFLAYPNLKSSRDFLYASNANKVFDKLTDQERNAYDYFTSFTDAQKAEVYDRYLEGYFKGNFTGAIEDERNLELTGFGLG